MLAYLEKSPLEVELNYDTVIAKYQIDLYDLEKMAHEQGNALNLSMIYIVTKCDMSSAHFILQYLNEKGIKVITEDVEPDGEWENLAAQDDDIKPFNPSQIDIKFSQLIIGAIIERITYGELDFDSEFQRKSGLWNNKQKSQLIESIFLNIPLPAFYFDATNDNKWIIIDGLQRLSTIKEFVVDKKLILSDMEFLHDLNGKTYEEIPRSLQRRIRETNITAYIVNPSTPPNVKYNIFKRINTGGLVLEPQEIRNALFQGKSTSFLRTLAQSEVFVKATDGSIRSDRMLDREFCLRYVAFTNLPLRTYTDMDERLNEAMVYLNQRSDEELQTIYRKFYNVMIYCRQLLGKHTFRKVAKDGRRRPINKALFEAWSLIVSRMTVSQKKILLFKKKQLFDSFIELCDYYSFQNYLRSSDKYSVNARIKAIHKIVNDLIGENNE